MHPPSPQQHRSITWRRHRLEEKALHAPRHEMKKAFFPRTPKTIVPTLPIEFDRRASLRQKCVNAKRRERTESTPNNRTDNASLARSMGEEGRCPLYPPPPDRTSQTYRASILKGRAVRSIIATPHKTWPTLLEWHFPTLSTSIYKWNSLCRVCKAPVEGKISVRHIFGILYSLNINTLGVRWCRIVSSSRTYQ